MDSKTRLLRCVEPKTEKRERESGGFSRGLICRGARCNKTKPPGQKVEWKTLMDPISSRNPRRPSDDWRARAPRAGQGHGRGIVMGVGISAAVNVLDETPDWPCPLELAAGESANDGTSTTAEERRLWQERKRV